MTLEEFTVSFNRKFPDQPLDRRTITRILQANDLRKIETRGGPPPYHARFQVYFPGVQVSIEGGALGRYMCRPGLPDPSGLRDRPPRIGHPSFAYDAFILSPFTRMDLAEGSITHYYLMSTVWPYQVQVMRSVLALGR